MSDHDQDYAEDLRDWYAEDDDLWDRPTLKHIHDFARSRRACPNSTLAAALARAVCQIPPWVKLPPIVGGRTAINLFAALVGESGAGKGASEAAARDAITWVNPAVEYLPERPLGSGEGLARTYMDLEDCLDILTVLWCAPEIDTLRALFARQGATLEGELRKLYMGEQLGFTNSDKKTRTFVKGLTYRAGLIAGVQPLRAGMLLGGADGGTPQRFLWALTRDPDMPEQRPPELDPLTVTVPKFAPGDLWVPPVARAEIERHQLDYHHGMPGIDPLDGHALLTQLKVAAALMVLDGRDRLNNGDWKLAADIMAHSSATRAAVARATEAQHHHRNRGRAADAAERAEYMSDRKLARAKRTILRQLDKSPDGECVNHAALRRTFKSDVRDEFDPAIAQLIDEGQILKVQMDRGHGYLRSTRPPFVHPTSPAETWGGPKVDGGPKGYDATRENAENTPEPCSDCGGTETHRDDCPANPNNRKERPT
jgi:hypothetical protein